MIDAQISISRAQSGASNSCWKVRQPRNFSFSSLLSLIFFLSPSFVIEFSVWFSSYSSGHYLMFLSPFIIYTFLGISAIFVWSSTFGWMTTANGLVGFAVFGGRAELGDSTLGWFWILPPRHSLTRYSKTFSTPIFAISATFWDTPQSEVYPPDDPVFLPMILPLIWPVGTELLWRHRIRSLHLKI